MTPHPKLGFTQSHVKTAGPSVMNIEYPDRTMISSRADQMTVSAMEIVAADDESFHDGDFVMIAMRVGDYSVHAMIYPDHARTIAATLLGAANAIDGGICQ
jgi:hypothetical protein